MSKNKLVDIEITEDDVTTTYAVGPLLFADVMANEELKAAAGFKTRKAVVVDPGGYEHDDEGRPVPEVTSENISDYQSMVVSVICGTVRKRDGEKIHLTDDDINELSLQHVLVLFNAIQQVIKPQEGGRQAVTFQVVTGSDGDAGESVPGVRDDAEPVHSET